MVEEQLERQEIDAALPLVLSMLAGPLAWTAHLLLSYPLLPIACALGSNLILHVVTVLTALIALAGAWTAYRHRDPSPERISEYSDASLARRRFMTYVGVTIDVLFLYVILMEGVPNFVINPCVGGP